MPDHDTYDLDAAFARLEQEVTALSTAPGAGAAVARARRRRRTRTGAIAAVAVLAVAGVAVGQSLSSHDESVAPADHLPAPARLTDERLASATEGWTPAWTANTAAAQHKMQLTFGGDCFPSFGGGQADGYTLFGNSHDDLAITTTSDFTGDPSGEPVALQRMVSDMEGCPGAQEVSSFNGPSGVAGHTYQVRTPASEPAPEYVWIVSTGQGIGVLKILGQSDPLPSVNDAAVTDALVAAVEFRVEHSDPRTNGSVQRIDPTKTVGQVWANDFGPALAGWDNPWEPQLQDVSGPEMPTCAGGFVDSATGSSETVNVGRNGHEWVQWFDDETAAKAAVEQLQQNLTSCSTPFTFHTVTLPDGRPVLVGVGPEVLWVERVASHVLLVHIPPGSTPPPDEVSLRVGAVLEHVLEQPATTTMSPGGKVPSWMKHEIAAAPTFGP